MSEQKEASLQAHLNVWEALYERRDEPGDEYRWSGQEILEAFEAHLEERFGIQPYME